MKKKNFWLIVMGFGLLILYLLKNMFLSRSNRYSKDDIDKTIKKKEKDIARREKRTKGRKRIEKKDIDHLDNKSVNDGIDRLLNRRDKRKG